jgi:hypothetical protein
MFELIILSIISVSIITPCGYILNKNNADDIITLSNHLIYGVIIISFVALLINFVLPLNIFVNSLILLLPLSIFLKKLRIYLTLNFFRFLFFNSIIIFLLIAKSDIYRPDAILYHLPYTSILNEEKIIFGLSNLHSRFAHISIIQYFSAFFNNYIFGVKGITLSIAIIASSIIVNFLAHSINYLKIRKFNFHFFYLFSILIFIAYKMNRYGEYGNDAPTHFLFFFLISEIIQSFNNKKISFNHNNFILAVFILLNKITMAFAIFLPIIFLKKDKLFKLFTTPKNYFAIIFLSLWVFKNIIISGCVIYPISQLCFKNFEWSNINQTENLAAENEAWTKGWPDFNNKNNISHTEYNENYNWVSTWSKGHLIKIIKILVPYILLLILVYLVIHIKLKNITVVHNKVANKEYFILIIMMVLFSIVWFLKIPVYRYGYSYFVSFLSLGFAYVCTLNYSLKKNSYKFFGSFLIIFTLIFVLKNTIRIIKPENQDHRGLFPKTIFINKSNVKKIQLNDFAYYKSDKMCGYGFSPCTHYETILKSKKYFNYKVFLNSDFVK